MADLLEEKCLLRCAKRVAVVADVRAMFAGNDEAGVVSVRIEECRSKAIEGQDMSNRQKDRDSDSRGTKLAAIFEISSLR